jgi:hypothetical protein
LETVNLAENWMLEFFVWFLVAGAMKPGTLANYRASLSVVHAKAGQDVSGSTRSRNCSSSAETGMAGIAHGLQRSSMTYSVRHKRSITASYT